MTDEERSDADVWMAAKTVFHLAAAVSFGTAAARMSWWWLCVAAIHGFTVALWVIGTRGIRWKEAYEAGRESCGENLRYRHAQGYREGRQAGQDALAYEAWVAVRSKGEWVHRRAIQSPLGREVVVLEARMGGSIDPLSDHRPVVVEGFKETVE